VARYDTDGTLDATFDGDGVATTDLTAGFDIANAVTIQVDGKILAAGEAGSCCEYTGSFGLVRYDADGTLDATFGGDGIVITNFTRGDDVVQDVVIQPDGKIVAAGSTYPNINGLDGKLALARYVG
jgi:uncharacterized delta-60 repeat protein